MTNIILIHWHDTGRHLGCYGRADVVTPHLDRFAAGGTRFDRAFATAPLCSPSRSSIFTGRYPHSNGMMGLAHLGWGYHANERTLPMLLGRAGYATRLVGLQHESADPTTLGYDTVIDVNASRQAAPVVAELAVDQLGELATQNRPFLLVAGMFEPHRPFPEHRFPTTPDAPVDVPGFLQDNESTRQDLRAFQTAVTYADRATGRILDEIERLGLDQDSIVIFTTDHGIPFPRAKSTLYDAGLEVSLLIRMPGQRQPRVVEDLVSHVDLLPTLLDLVGVAVPANVQGVSYARTLDHTDDHGDAASPRREVFGEKNWHDTHQYDPVRCVRTDRFKYIRSFADRPQTPLPGDIAKAGSAIGVDAERQRGRVELYDLSTDPDELNNLAGRHEWGGVQGDLARRLDAWQRDTDDPLLRGPIQAPRFVDRPRGAHRGRTQLIDEEFVQGTVPPPSEGGKESARPGPAHH